MGRRAVTTTAEHFVRQLRDGGCHDILLIEREPDGALDPHSHPFESKVRVPSELTLVICGRKSHYRTGDVFRLRHSELHAERYGPAGLRYLVGAHEH